MKKLLSVLAVCTLLLTACTQSPDPAPAAPVTTAPAPKPEPAPAPKAKFPVHCFEQRMSDGSVLSFQYTEYYDDVVGILDYTFAQKDGAHGTFVGKKEGNIIKATWSYVVEGSNQKEEIMVRVQGDKAVKASGELTEGKGGMLMLKDPATATWEESFTRVQCD